MNFIYGIFSFLIISFSKVSASDNCYYNNNYEFFDELFDFNDWRLSHNVDFSSPEEIIWRHSIWQKNKQFVDSHNAEERGFEVALNHLAHEEWPLNCNLMSNDVLQETYFEDPHDKLSSSNNPFPDNNVCLDDNLPSVDWRDKNVVTPIKTKVSVVLVGHFLLLVPLKVITLLKLENSFLLVNHKLLIAMLMELILVAQADLWMTLFNTL